jgi:superfamily II DNA or RNA helicase
VERTYGSAVYNSKLKIWEISAEPHVMIRLKRWFAKVDSTAYGKVRISASPDVAADLSAFIVRYPLALLPSERVLKEQVDQYRERQSIVSRILEGGYEPKSFSLKLPARDYQKVAADMWLNMGGLLLADDIGTGKTISALCGLTNSKTLPALVVCPTHLTIQWSEQIAKFTNLTSHILKKGTPYDILKYTNDKLPDVIICNYHKLAGWCETLSFVSSVIFDEAHELRHRGSQKYAAAKFLSETTNFRIGLTASPVVNYGGEIWNVINLLCPDRLGTWEEFLREWCSWIHSDKPRIKDPAAFGTFLRSEGIMLRRTRKEVDRELPPVTIIPHQISSDVSVFDTMKGNAAELAKLILRDTQEFKGQKMQAAGEFDLRLRMATGISKAPYVAEFVRMLIEESGEPVVLYGWHRSVYELWLEKLKDFNPVMYTGSESPTEKEASKQRFLSKESKVMIISLRAGAGLDGLQDICHIAVFGELDWANIHGQCIGRIHRDGQDAPVVAYFLVSEFGSDPIMCDVLGVKKQQLEGLLNPNGELVIKNQPQEHYIKRLARDYLERQGIKYDYGEDVLN